MYKEISQEKWDKGYNFYRSFHQGKPDFIPDYCSFYLSRIYRLSLKNPIKRFFLRSLYSRFAASGFRWGLQKLKNRRQMITSTYVEYNRKKCYYISIDLDIVIDDISKFLSTLSSFLPPTIIVFNRLSRHCHLIYELSTPYSLSSDDSKFTTAKLFRDYLNDSLGGDKNYNGFTVRNPLNLFNHNIYYTDRVYDWDEIHRLISFSVLKVDLSEVKDDLREYTEIKAPVFYPRLNFRVKEGRRNVTLFDYGRKYAYGIARVIRSRDHLFTKVKSYLEYLNDAFCDPTLPSPEIYTIAKSIADWVWDRIGYFLSVRYKAPIPMDRLTLKSKQKISALETTKKKLLKTKRELYKRFITFYNSIPFIKHGELGRRLLRVKNYVKGNRLIKFKTKQKNIERDSIIKDLKEIFNFKTNSKLYRYLKFIARLIKRFFLDFKFSSHLTDNDGPDKVFTFKRRLLLSDLDYAPLDKFKSRFWLSRFSISIDGIYTFLDFDYWYQNIQHLS